MFAVRRLLCKFSNTNIAPHTPAEIVTVYRPDLHDYRPPNSMCLLPAVGMATISSITDWSPTNVALTAGLTGLGLLYYLIRSASHSFNIVQIDATSDLSGFYNSMFMKKLAPGVQFDTTTNILQIPKQRIEVGSFTSLNKINSHQVFLKLNLHDITYRLPIGPINIEDNLAIDYKNHLRTFVQQRHDEGII